MKRLTRCSVPIAVALAIALLLGSSRIVIAQSPDSSTEEREALKLAKEVIDGQKKELQTLRDQVADLKAQISKLNQDEGVLEKEKELMNKREKDLEEIIQDERKKAEILEAGIRDRDEVIKVLAKGSKESTARKIAESIPAVAGIIAMAIVAK